MTILELNFARSWRGGERQTLFNASGFKSRNNEVELLCRSGSVLEQKAMEIGLKVNAFPHIWGLLFFLIIKGHKFDLLHAQTSHVLTYCILTKPFHRRRVAFTRRIDFIPKGLFTFLKYRLADFRIGVSEPVKRILEEFARRKAFMISDIAVSKVLNEDRARSVLRQKGIDVSKTILATTAALVQHKDPLTMVQSIKVLSEKRKDFIFLHFGEGPLELEIKSKIKELALENVYFMMGFFPDVEDFFSIFDVFLMSSEEEGLGSSVLDAFLYQVPVISTNAGGLEDLLKEGRGVSCEKHDPGALAAGIETVLENSELAVLFAEKAYNYVISYHSSDYITDEYLKMLTPRS